MLLCLATRRRFRHAQTKPQKRRNFGRSKLKLVYWFLKKKTVFLEQLERCRVVCGEGQYAQFRRGTLLSIRLRHVFRKRLYPDLNWERVLLVERGSDSSAGEISGGLRGRIFAGEESDMTCLILSVYMLLR